MKIYQYTSNKSAIFEPGGWYLPFQCAGHAALNPDDWREIDPTKPHIIQLDSCEAQITADSVTIEHDWPGFPTTLSLEEMQRVTRCMEMLKDANS